MRSAICAPAVSMVMTAWLGLGLELGLGLGLGLRLGSGLGLGLGLDGGHGLVGEVKDRRGQHLRRHLHDVAHEVRVARGLSCCKRGGASLASGASVVRRAAATHEPVAPSGAVAAMQSPPG